MDIETKSGDAPLRCGVVGVGRMGGHHARVYSQMAGVTFVGVVDQNEERRESVADSRGCSPYATVQELVDAGVDAVTVAVPTTAHLREATPLLKAGVAVLIEKPLAPDVNEARQIADLAARSGAILQVGHIERLNPVVRAVRREQNRAPGTLLPRFIEVHRVSPMTFRSLDVSVVFDMMIHDLDVVLMMMDGREPTRIEATGVPVITEHDDVCNARLTFEGPEGACVANVTASRLAMKTERKTRIIAEDGYISIDFAKRSGVLIRRTANELQLEAVREALREGKDLSDLDYSEVVEIEELQVDDADQLESQITDFLDCVRTGRRPEVDAEAGFSVVRTAERIEAASRAVRMALPGQ